MVYDKKKGWMLTPDFPRKRTGSWVFYYMVGFPGTPGTFQGAPLGTPSYRSRATSGTRPPPVPAGRAYITKRETLCDGTADSIHGESCCGAGGRGPTPGMRPTEFRLPSAPQTTPSSVGGGCSVPLYAPSVQVSVFLG